MNIKVNQDLENMSNVCLNVLLKLTTGIPIAFFNGNDIFNNCRKDLVTFENIVPKLTLRGYFLYPKLTLRGYFLYQKLTLRGYFLYSKLTLSGYFLYSKLIIYHLGLTMDQHL